MARTYSYAIRRRADRYFAAGFGYKAVANMMELPEGTVRDWKRQWASDTSEDTKPRFAEALREVMMERKITLIWRQNEDIILEAYRRAKGKSSLRRYSIQRVMIGVAGSELFERVPVSVRTADIKGYSPVYRLLEGPQPLRK